MARLPFLLLFLLMALPSYFAAESGTRVLKGTKSSNDDSPELEDLADRVLCLESATYSVDPVSGELLRSDCRGNVTSLGVVVGPPGAVGPQGPAGPTGPQGPSGIDADVSAVENFLGAIYPELFSIRDKIYFRIDRLMNWQDAMAACREYPGFDLARIETQEENDFASTACTNPNQLCWIGLSDTVQEGFMSWLTVSKLSRLPWLQMELFLETV